MVWNMLLPVYAQVQSRIQQLPPLFTEWNWEAAAAASYGTSTLQVRYSYIQVRTYTGTCRHTQYIQYLYSTTTTYHELYPLVRFQGTPTYIIFSTSDYHSTSTVRHTVCVPVRLPARLQAGKGTCMLCVPVLSTVQVPQGTHGLQVQYHIDSSFNPQIPTHPTAIIQVQSSYSVCLYNVLYKYICVGTSAGLCSRVCTYAYLKWVTFVVCTSEGFK